jgi:hypothetical protein
LEKAANWHQIKASHFSFN